MKTNEQDPRIIRTRKLLQTALLELMQEKPFQSISIGDITSRATLNRATFYLHYLDKFDLLSKTARDTFKEAINAKLPDLNSLCIHDICHLTQATCDYLVAFLDGCAPANKSYEPLIESEMLHVLYDYMYCLLDSELQDQGYTLLTETSAMMVSSSILNMSLKWSRKETNYPRDKVVEEVYRVVTQGIGKYYPEI